MNNDQFRRLAFGSGASAGAKSDANSNATPARASGVLGSRKKASIPMTPRSGSNVSRLAFARQMAERYGDEDKQKKFRTSKPKGSKFAAGYVDRAKIRTEQEQDDDREARLTALEELYKKEEVDRATYEKLRFEIAGGDLSSTHLVKGLDFKLLNRVRQGEDVFDEGRADKQPENDEDSAAPDTEDVDDEFGRLEESEVQAVEREKTKKKGQYSAAALVPGQKRSRDQILAELKAAREAAKQKAAESALGSRFKKIGATQAAGSRIERDSRGREVLVIVDEDGHEKRKVRRVAVDADADAELQEAPAQDAKVLGMEVPEFYRKKKEAEAAAAAAKVVDIFEDAGSDYDPLAGMDSGSSDSDSDEDEEIKKAEEPKKDEKDNRRRRRSTTPLSDREDGEASDSSREGDSRRRRKSPPRSGRKEEKLLGKPLLSHTAPEPAAAPRKSYFGGSKLMSEEASRGGPSLNDPSVLAALRKAKQMREATESEEKSKEAEREERLKKLIQSGDRDAEDLDMGFGTNRLEDGEDMEDGGERIKLSTWGKDNDDGNDGGESRGNKSARKRGSKKRKGDVNNAADVMRVLDQRREAGGS